MREANTILISRTVGRGCAALLLLASLAAAGCTGRRTPELSGDILEVSGLFRSNEQVGPLGRLTLNLVRREETFTIYDATLAGDENEDLGADVGVGTLGDSHLILNFDRGLNSDYYFQGFVSMAGSQPSELTGTFIFPDQEEPLAVSFQYAGPPIIEPEEE